MGQKHMIEHCFDFLNNYGYSLKTDNSKCFLSFEGKNNRIDIIYSEYEHEITCQFEDKEKTKSFSLQDVLNFLNINDSNGLYQISTQNDMEKGLIYVANTLEAVFSHLNVSKTDLFDLIYESTYEKRKKELAEYYVKEELRKADDYWEKKKYDKAYELYRKNIDSLSKSQFKKMTITEHNIK